MRRMWNAEDVQSLENYVREGKTYEEIARLMGTTVPAVYGKAYRLGIYQKKHADEELSSINDDPLPLSCLLTQEEKEARLFRLMDKMRVRLI